MDVKKGWIDLLGLVHLWKGNALGEGLSQNKGGSHEGELRWPLILRMLSPRALLRVKHSY
jgi:hypothetical protein